MLPQQCVKGEIKGTAHTHMHSMCRYELYVHILIHMKWNIEISEYQRLHLFHSSALRLLKHVLVCTMGTCLGQCIDRRSKNLFFFSLFCLLSLSLFRLLPRVYFIIYYFMIAFGLFFFFHFVCLSSFKVKNFMIPFVGCICLDTDSVRVWALSNNFKHWCTVSRHRQSSHTD